MSKLLLPSVALATSLLTAALFARAGEVHQVIEVNGETGGFSRSVTREIVEDGVTLFETTATSTLRIARMDVPIEIATDSSVVEDAAGKIVRISSRLSMAKNDTVFVGKVIDDELVFTATTTGKPREMTIDFSDDIPGPVESSRRLAATKFVPGASTTFHVFDFSYGDPIETTFTCEASEEVELKSGRRLLHRFRVAPEGPGLPPSTRWVDDTGETRKESMSMMGLEIVSIDADEQQYLAASGTKGAEMFTQSIIDSNRKLTDRRGLKELIYRLSPKKPGTELSLPETRAQGWIEENGERLFRIRVVVPENDGKQLVGATVGQDDPALADALAPDALIQSDDPAIVEFAQDEVEGETNAWRAARRLEKAVRDHITKKSMGVGFASASETFETCEGDCSEHAVLLAACCRVVGIPARIAMGLVYAPLGDDNGVFGGHAWTEVSIDGEWYALDATLGIGHADPTHIQMSTSLLKSGSLQGAFTGMLENLGNLNLEIVREVR